MYLAELRQAVNPTTDIFIRGGDAQRHTEEKSCEVVGKADRWSYKLRITHNTERGKRSRKDFSLEDSEGSDLADILILDFSFRSCDRISFCLF